MTTMSTSTRRKTKTKSARPVDDRDRFVILDLSSLIYRALLRRGPDLCSPFTDEPTRGTYEFCKSLFALVDVLQPAYVAAAMDDARVNVYRRQIFAGYKANRPEGDLDEDVPVQIGRMMQILRLLGVATVFVAGEEADDVIASLVDVCASPEVEAIVVSRDKDLHQLVGPHCRAYDPISKDFVDEAAVERVWGVPARLVGDVKTLAGDTGDNVPGVRGLGEKKAAKLVREHGDVAGVLAACEEGCLTQAVTQALREADIHLCRELVTLRRDLSLDVMPEDLEFNGFDIEAVRDVFVELGFRSFLDD